MPRERIATIVGKPVHSASVPKPPKSADHVKASEYTNRKQYLTTDPDPTGNIHQRMRYVSARALELNLRALDCELADRLELLEALIAISEV